MHGGHKQRPRLHRQVGDDRAGNPAIHLFVVLGLARNGVPYRYRWRSFRRYHWGVPEVTTPIFVRDVTAARILDMKPAEFLRLVDEGALPQPDKFDRWYVPAIVEIMRGDAAKYGRLEM
jgi:hypothetical protein